MIFDGCKGAWEGIILIQTKNRMIITIKEEEEVVVVVV